MIKHDPAATPGCRRGADRAQRPRQHGIAILAALLVLVVFGLLLTTLTGSITAAARHSRNHDRDARHDQLLLAGMLAARARLNNAITTAGQAPAEPLRFNVAIPAALQQRGGKVTVRIAPPAQSPDRRVRVEAVLHDRTTTQTLIFRRDDNGWRLLPASAAAPTNSPSTPTLADAPHRRYR